MFSFSKFNHRIRINPKTTPLLLLLLTSCANLPDIEPDRTTYPRDRVIEENVKMWVMPDWQRTLEVTVPSNDKNKPLYEKKSKSQHSVTYDFSQTKTGDTAEHTVRIIPNRNGRVSVSALVNLVPERVEQVCGKNYRIAKSKYYDGTEATARMLGMKSSYLELEIRCPVHNPITDNETYKFLRQLATGLDDSEYFDVLTKRYYMKPDILFSKLTATSISRGIPVIEEGSTDGNYYLLSRKKPIGEGFGGKFQLAAVIQPMESGAVLSMVLGSYKLLCHETALKRGGFLCIPGGPVPWHGSVVPWNRKAAYHHAKEFLAYLEREINKN